MLCVIGRQLSSDPIAGVMTDLNRIFPWIAYPTVITGGIALHYALLQWNQSLITSTYVPVLIAAALITLFEFRFPHYQAWLPKKEDTKNDLWYMGIVQIALPRLIAFLFVLALVEPIQSMGWSVTRFWPHHLSVGAQAILMILTADFFRYWLHRAMHENKFLWRFHAVHHSPPKLYWLNVGRFHPVDKILQLLLDTLPFILLGVSEQVIALYFVFYAMNGFFQHSNIELRFGFLNYIISSAELHRWHHSRVSKESNTNYGNNLIIWDLLFGTWFLPQDRAINDLGLSNRRYPYGFLEQLKTPFVAGLTDKDLPLPSARELLKPGLMRLTMMVCRFWYWWPLVRKCQKPLETQTHVLLSILAQNRDTRFGMEHQFSGIRGVAQFQRQVPIQNYETLLPYLEEQEQTGKSALYCGRLVLYALTSGTTSDPKYIPVLETTLQQYKQQQRLLTYFQYMSNPQAFSGKVLGIMGPAIEGHRESGTPYGSASAYVYKTMPKVVQANYVVPSEAFEIADYDLKYKVILRLALAERDITYLGSANPSSFLRVLEILNTHRREMVMSLESGSLSGVEKLPAPLSQVLQEKIKPAPAQAACLRALDHKEEITYRDVWPGIRMLVTWTGGSCGIALDALRKKLPADIIVIDVGYLASEFRGSITVDAATNGGVPTLTHHFFEFVEREQWDQGDRDCITLDQLEIGKTYYVVVTTGSGLYRYFINDLVEVIGHFHSTPLIKFVQKGRGVTNITGEKMYENHIIQAVKNVENAHEVSTVFFLLLADELDARYQLFIELQDTLNADAGFLAEVMDHELRHLNLEYDQKRASGRLKPLEVHRLRRGSSEAYKQFCMGKGQREGQFKPIVLQYKKEFDFGFTDYIEN